MFFIINGGISNVSFIIKLVCFDYNIVLNAYFVGIVCSQGHMTPKALQVGATTELKLRALV
jgi:hypothetical protein